MARNSPLPQHPSFPCHTPLARRKTTSKQLSKAFGASTTKKPTQNKSLPVLHAAVRKRLAPGPCVRGLICSIPQRRASATRGEADEKVMFQHLCETGQAGR